MTTIMASFKPKWCVLIANGKKKIEVRKTVPKSGTPFKVLMYCTKDKSSLPNFADMYLKSGKVIGEFVCDNVSTIMVSYSGNKRALEKLSAFEIPYTCLSDLELMNYLGNGNEGYGWNISGLKIYDEPKELSEFVNKCDFDEGEKCDNCKELSKIFNCRVKRPPQSWFYVEELQ